MQKFDRKCLTLQPFKSKIHSYHTMNLYIRYFNDEVVVHDTEQALDFIRGIENFNCTPQFEKDFREYAEGSMPYPKRYKVRARVYFIVIKTTAATLAEFKANGKEAQQAQAQQRAGQTETSAGQTETSMSAEADPHTERKPLRPKDQIVMMLNKERPGWYEGTIRFKRVVYIPETGKCDYRDNTFVARVKAVSAQDCYNRMVDYLQSRDDIDPRSQFPSPKGKNFVFNYLGIKPLAEVIV